MIQVLNLVDQVDGDVYRAQVQGSLRQKMSQFGILGLQEPLDRQVGSAREKPVLKF